MGRETTHQILFLFYVERRLFEPTTHALHTQLLLASRVELSPNRVSNVLAVAGQALVGRLDNGLEGHDALRHFVHFSGELHLGHALRGRWQECQEGWAAVCWSNDDALEASVGDHALQELVDRLYSGQWLAGFGTLSSLADLVEGDSGVDVAQVDDLPPLVVGQHQLCELDVGLVLQVLGVDDFEFADQIRGGV